MSGVDDLMMEITPQVLLKAYACGIFPMAESADDPGLYWVEPEMRGIIPLNEFYHAVAIPLGHRDVETGTIVFGESFPSLFMLFSVNSPITADFRLY